MNGRPIKRLGFIVLVVVALAGCDHAPKPTPFPTLPTLDRPVQVVPAAVTDALITVPPAAVVRRSGIPGVFVLQQGLARFRMVRPGKLVDGRLQIISGLTGSETLVLGDLNPVHDGNPIRPAQ